MKLLAHLYDDQFENNGFNHTRKIVRAVILNEQNKVGAFKIYGDDIFGHRDYYELPGGGVKKGETLQQALRREVIEEVGVTIKDIRPIGRIIDYYNLINRQNDNHFYLCKIDQKLNDTHLEEYEKVLMHGMVWLDIDEMIELYNSVVNAKISTLVKNRELIILKEVKKMLG